MPPAVQPVVLLVDDRPENLLALEALLAPLAADSGARVVSVRSAEEALRHVLGDVDAIAVVLLDVRMPGIGGLETTRLIRSRARSGRVPIVLVTAEAAGAAEIEAGYEAGAVDFLFKPLIPAVVRAKVRTFVELFLQREAARDAAWIAATAQASQAHAEAALKDETALVETVRRIGAALASELDVERIVQMVTDEATVLTRAQFGAFFYNVHDPVLGEAYTLYALSGVPREHFARFPHPRATAVFGPTFRGERVVRSDDITADPSYGKSAPHHGMPAGHLPVRSYLAVPVRSRGGEILGGLFFGHADVAVFTEREERLVVGIAGWAAVAMDNARLVASERQARSAAEDAGARVAEHARELESANQQLQDNATELEAANDELQSTAAALEERTAQAEQASAEADAASRRVAFLADATDRLGSALDYEATIGEVVRLAVPGVADWAAYSVDGGGGIVDLVAIRHADPAIEALAHEIRRRYPIRADEPAGVAQVLRTGEPELIRELPDSLLETVAQDAEHLALIRRIGFRSLLTVPVTAQGRVLGALSFGTGGSGRLFDERDVELVRELARRAGTAIDHARLYDEAQTRRREAEAERERAAGILESMADAHFVLDSEYHFVSANAAMQRNVARTRDELLGRSIWELFPGTVGTVFERSYRQVVERGIEAHFVGEYDEDGLSLVPEVDAYPAAGGGAAVFWRDVGPRRRAERALEESERQFRTLADAIPALAWTARADGYLDWYNARWYEYTGTAPDEMLGSGWRSVMDPALVSEVSTRWQASVDSGAPFEMTVPLRGADGRFRRFLTRAVPLRDVDGRVTQWVGTNTDVEAERAARAEVEAAEVRLRTVFEQAPVAVAVLEGPEHVYSVVSPVYAASPGHGRPLIGLSVREAFPEIVDQGYLGPMDRVYETGEPFAAHEREVFLVPAGGGAPAPHYFNVGYQPLLDGEGRVYAIASVAYDVTEHVRARREAEEARSEAERQRAAAEEANRAKSQFLSTMSHELRTPLNAIGGYVELIEMGLRGPVTELQRLDLERIRRANQHLMSLISDILNFAKLEAGQVELHLSDVEFGDVVADIEPLIGPQLAAKGLSFRHDGCAPDTPEKPHAVRADPEKLRQILLNLLSNAVKFTEAGGRVELSCETDAAAGVVHVRVADTGRGIPAAQQSRIFEPFVQVDRHLTAASQQGVGLGLAISRDLARGMGGDLTLESVEGEGSTFRLTLPRAKGSRQ